jgi:hypothetical protein
MVILIEGDNVRFKTLIMLVAVIILHVSFFNYVTKSSEFHSIQNTVKGFKASRFVQVSVNEIDIQKTTTPDKLIVTLLISVKNKGDSTVTPAKFSLKTRESLEGNKVLHYTSWQPLTVEDLAPGEQQEGAVSFVIPKSDSFIFTYGEGIMSSQFRISSIKELFIPYIINA